VYVGRYGEKRPGGTVLGVQDKNIGLGRYWGERRRGTVPVPEIQDKTIGIVGYGDEYGTGDLGKDCRSR
jgi:hypothetical protein